MPLTCTCGCNQPSTSRGCRLRGLWFASRLCRYRYAAKIGRLGDISRRERAEIEALEAGPHAYHERFVPGLFSETPLDEAAADAILRERIQAVFSEQLAHINRWRPADDSPAAERALRELVTSDGKEPSDGEATEW